MTRSPERGRDGLQPSGSCGRTGPGPGCAPCGWQGWRGVEGVRGRPPRWEWRPLTCVSSVPASGLPLLFTGTWVCCKSAFEDVA